MKNRFQFTLFLVLLCTNTLAQLYEIKLGGSIDSTGKFIESFDFNLNRTEQQEEGGTSEKYLLGGNKHKWYLQPTASINLGAGAQSNSNDFYTSAIFRNVRNVPIDKSVKIDSTLSHKKRRNYLLAWDIAPVINADKNFQERIAYVQTKFNYTLLKTKTPFNKQKKFSSFAFVCNPFVNIGGRNSRNYSSNVFYITSGIYNEISFDLKKYNATTVKNGDTNYTMEDYLTFSLKNEWVFIVNDLPALNMNFHGRHLTKASVDYYVNKQFSVGVEYKIGNLSPTYEAFNGGAIVFKFKK